jgi:hypothetical protein
MENKLLIADHLKKFGFTVGWDAQTGEVIISKDGNTGRVPKGTFPIENDRSVGTRSQLIQVLKGFGFTIPEGFSKGGVNSEPGLYPLHGTKTASEVIFNATDAKKLYDFVKNASSISSRLGFGNITNKVIPQVSGGSGININFENLVSVQGNVDQSTMPKLQTIVESASNLVVDKIKNELYKAGLVRR